MCPSLEAPQAEEEAVLGSTRPSPRVGHGWLCLGITRRQGFGQVGAWRGEGDVRGEEAGAFQDIQGPIWGGGNAHCCLTSWLLALGSIRAEGVALSSALGSFLTPVIS